MLFFFKCTDSKIFTDENIPTFKIFKEMSGAQTEAQFALHL